MKLGLVICKLCVYGYMSWVVWNLGIVLYGKYESIWKSSFGLDVQFRYMV